MLRQCQSGLDPKSVGLISGRRTPDHTFWGGQSAPPMSWLCPVICLPCGWWSSGNSQTQNIGAATPSALPAHFSVYSVRRGGECAQEGDPCYTHLHHPALAEAQTLGRGGGAYAFPQDGAKEKLADNPHTRLGKAGVGGSGRRSKGLGSERGPSLQRTTKIPTGKLHCIPPHPPGKQLPVPKQTEKATGEPDCWPKKGDARTLGNPDPIAGGGLSGGVDTKAGPQH